VIIPHHRENRLFVILAEQEFFFPVVVLSPKFLSELRMTVGVCEIARMIAQDEAFTLVCLKSPIHLITAKLVTGHRFFLENSLANRF
jgi:hypothetical protein